MPIREETQFEDHFPVTVMHSKHTGLEDVNRSIFEVIRTLRDAHINDPKENEALTGTVTTYGGYQTSKKMQFLNRKEEAIQVLRDQVIQPGIRRYMQKVFSEQGQDVKTRVAAWANILRAGDWQAPHLHPNTGNLVSGVYYVDVPEKPKPQGCIEFLNPHPVSRHHGVGLTRRLYPQTGDLLLFPPYYIHYVYPFQGPGERAIIAFDVILVSELVF